MDWWSLGVLGHRLCTGAMPWPRGRDHREQLHLVDLAGVDLSGGEVDDAVRSLVIACFHPEDAERERRAREAADKMRVMEGADVDFLSSMRGNIDKDNTSNKSTTT